MKEQTSPLVKKLTEMEPEPDVAEMIRRDRDADEEERIDRLFDIEAIAAEDAEKISAVDVAYKNAVKLDEKLDKILASQ